MKKLMITFTATLLASSAFADLASGKYSFGVSGAYIAFAQSRHLQNSGAFGLNTQYFFSPTWSANLSALQFSTDQKQAPKKGVNGQLYDLTGSYYFQAMTGLYPYLTAGGGLWHFSRVEASDPQTQANLLAGAGALYFMDDSIAIDLGANEIYDTSTGQSDPMASFSIHFFFGGAQGETENSSKNS